MCETGCKGSCGKEGIAYYRHIVGVYNGEASKNAFIGKIVQGI